MSHALCLCACISLFACHHSLVYETNTSNDLTMFLRHAFASMGMLFGIWLLAGAQLLTMLCKMIQPRSTLSIYAPQATSDIQERLYAALHVHFKTQTPATHTLPSAANVREYWSFLLHISLTLPIKVCIDRVAISLISALSVWTSQG